MRYLRQTTASKINSISNIISLVIHCILAPILIINLNMGLMGIAISNTVSAFINLAIQTIFLNKLSDKNRHLSIFQYDELKSLTKSTIFKTCENYIGFWKVVVLVFAAGREGDQMVIGMIIILNL